MSNARVRLLEFLQDSVRLDERFRVDVDVVDPMQDYTEVTLDTQVVSIL